METQQVSKTKGLRDFLLKKRLNLSQKSWNQLYNDKWHDEIYTSRKDDLFRRYYSPGIKNPYPVCVWKSNIIEQKIPVQSVQSSRSKSTNELVNTLETQTSDLKLIVRILSLMNFGLLITHLIR